MLGSPPTKSRCCSGSAVWAENYRAMASSLRRPASPEEMSTQQDRHGRLAGAAVRLQYGQGLSPFHYFAYRCIQNSSYATQMRAPQR